MKLTKPQQDLLLDVYRGNGHVSDTYQPARKLVALGLCVWRKVGFGDFLDLTDAGRAALADQEPAKPQEATK